MLGTHNEENVAVFIEAIEDTMLVLEHTNTDQSAQVSIVETIYSGSVR